MIKSTELVESITELLDAKLAEDIVTVNLTGQSELADYFVLATAGSTVHAQALAETVVAELRERGERVNHVEGLNHGIWVLLDYVDVVVHIFTSEARQYYGLERLWGDLPSARCDSPERP